MKLFVTGGTGFIGSHFLRQANRAGHQLVALRRSSASACRIDIGFNPQWVEAPLDNASEEMLAGCDAVVHLAAHSANVPYDTLENCLRWNLVAPLALFHRAITAGITRFVIAGSCFEYGRAGERYEFIPPDAPLEPTQTYPASKAAASIAFSQLAIDYSLRLSIHRIFQVYGEGEAEHRLWPAMTKAAISGADFDLTPAEQVRDFIPVEMVAEKLIEALHWPHVTAGQPYICNLGTGRPQKLREFAESIWEKHRAKGKLRLGALPYRQGEVMRYVPKIQ